MDRWTRLGGGVAVVLDLRSSYDQVAGRPAGTPGASSASLLGVDEIMLPRRRANKSQPSCCDIFPTGHVVSVLWGLGGLAGE
jgi:hypothetical protein